MADSLGSVGASPVAMMSAVLAGLGVPSGSSIQLSLCATRFPCTSYKSSVGSRNSGGKIQCVRVAAATTIAEAQPPKSMDCDWIAATIRQLSEEGARDRIEGVNAAIAKIADQEVTPELAESGRRERHAPWGIQRSLRGKTAEQVAVQVELIDKSMSRAGDVIVPVRVLQRVSDKQYPAGVWPDDVLDIEWRIAHRDRWIAKTASSYYSANLIPAFCTSR
jgi:hypothetical protein